MRVFDLYRSGYEQGYEHGSKNERRRAHWELLVCAPLTWLPFTDPQSFCAGYESGYDAGTVFRKFREQSS